MQRVPVRVDLEWLYLLRPQSMSVSRPCEVRRRLWCHLYYCFHVVTVRYWHRRTNFHGLASFISKIWFLLARTDGKRWVKRTLYYTYRQSRAFWIMASTVRTLAPGTIAGSTVLHGESFVSRYRRGLIFFLLRRGRPFINSWVGAGPLTLTGIESFCIRTLPTRSPRVP